jgi:hypothetical protein
MKKTAKSRKQIADEYGISTKTLSRWFKKENLKVSNGLLNPLEVDIIYRSFGHPNLKQ